MDIIPTNNSIRTIGAVLNDLSVLPTEDKSAQGAVLNPQWCTENPVTIVTAFFDIGREKSGDGRSVDEYKQWIQRTLQLNCNLFVVTEERFRDFFVKNRPPQYPMVIKVIDFKDSHYYQYYDQMKEIINDPVYKSKIQHPNRVECILPEYNIIQYSKFHYVEMAMKENPFGSDFFFWMDAGCSRFFMDVNISIPFPGKNTIQHLLLHPNQLIIQKRHDLEAFPINEQFIWRSDNLLYGTMFGGGKEIFKTISQKVEIVFKEKMLANKNVNNEQLALSFVWKRNPELFWLTLNSSIHHLILFKYLSF